jgi:Flp pilus assembly protein TadG
MPKRRTRSSQSGQAALMVTLSLPLTLGLIGLVVDVGWLYWRKEACRTAAQAAASASAIQANTLNTAWPASKCSASTSATGLWCSATAVQCPATPTASAPNNFQTACLYAQANGFTATGKQNVTVTANNGSTALAPGTTASYYVTVAVAEKIPLTFLAVMGTGNFGFATANASAGIVGTPVGGCLYLLDPSGKDAINASNNAHIDPSCGVYVNSNNTEAVLMTGSANITTSGTPQPPIQVVGGVNLNNGGSLSPAATVAAATADPLAGLDTPWTNCTGTGCPATKCQYTGCTGGPTQCDHTNYVLNSGSWGSPYTHLSPGIYCGGITISNGNGAIFDAGMYVINGGGVNITSVGSAGPNSGTGVIFYLTGTNANYAGFNDTNGTLVNFSAPTTGDLADVLVYQDRTLNPTAGNGASSTATSQFQGGASSSLAGIIYLPTTAVNFANGTTTTNKTSLVAYDAFFAGGTYVFTQDPAGTLQGSGAAKVYLIGAN